MTPRFTPTAPSALTAGALAHAARTILWPPALALANTFAGPSVAEWAAAYVEATACLTGSAGWPEFEAENYVNRAAEAVGIALTDADLSYLAACASEAEAAGLALAETYDVAMKETTMSDDELREAVRQWRVTQDALTVHSVRGSLHTPAGQDASKAHLAACETLYDLSSTFVPFEEGALVAVVDRGTFWECAVEGWATAVPKDPYFQTPVVGEVMQLFGRGHGHRVDRIVIGGRGYR